jgi:hypothetical protein
MYSLPKVNTIKGSPAHIHDIAEGFCKAAQLQDNEQVMRCIVV